MKTTLFTLTALLAASALAQQRISTNGACGNGVTCIGSSFGDCCSQYLYCGSKASYCSAGCNPSFGKCSSTSTSTPVSSMPAPSATSIANPTFDITVLDTTNVKLGKVFLQKSDSGFNLGVSTTAQPAYFKVDSDGSLFNPVSSDDVFVNANDNTWLPARLTDGETAYHNRLGSVNTNLGPGPFVVGKMGALNTGYTKWRLCEDGMMLGANSGEAFSCQGALVDVSLVYTIVS